MVAGRGVLHEGAAVRRGGRCKRRRRPPPTRPSRAASPRALAREPKRVVVEEVSRLCLLRGRGACAAALRRRRSLAPRRSARQLGSQRE
eukprot:scaffold90225_cov72-Phaeocystis_antarctica.AAC.1